MVTRLLGARRSQLTAEIAHLRREAAKLNTPSTYAKCARFQRLANAKDKELSELGGGPAVPGVPERLILLCNAVKVLILGLATLTLWDTPIAQVVPRSVAAPLGRLLAFPRGADLAAFGGVAVTPWLALVEAATTALARAAFPPLQTGAAQVDPERLQREAEATGRGRAGAAMQAQAAAQAQ
ncbi:hypothetical protein GPECTOR_5g252 [Gonium pectorale]|uniref:Uncharacterized protein n=1 Tax=Gonium pectorale TaxID=33097 RepID=A0A150GWH4_GONPE|nr:hypothetical protein GPECTOR_5g252 [Gonium pectorale]|eukprot:KXZ54154.1 hypothetical protein GPECTOR_5g252 [Gonium pectorale]